MAGTAIRVTKLREFQRGCRQAEKATRTEVAKALRDVGGPVREEAERQAVAQISSIGSKWSRMKVGSTVRSVYVAPAARRSGGSPRPNLGRSLMRSMLEAVDRKQDETIERFEEAIDEIADVFERR